jgi:MtaA/CmuA family methyltransferase
MAAEAPMTGRERVIASIEGRAVDSLPLIPISMMAAAAEIGEPYRRYILDARVHARGQAAFAGRYDIDHVSVISCPTTEAEDLGAAIIYYDDQPPAIDETHALLADKSKLARLRVPDPGAGRRMSKRLETVRLLKEAVGSDKLVEGWVEGPLAESCDLRGINAVMLDFYDDPQFLRDLMAFVFEVEMAFARAQVNAGADIIGVGDAAASLVGPVLYRDFVLEYEEKYVAALHGLGVPVRLHICGNINALLPMLAQVGADILDLDWMVPVRDARLHMGPSQLLSGNIDPVAVLYRGAPDDVTRGLAECFEQAGRSRYAVCAGCEIPRGTPPANLEAMRRFARGVGGARGLRGR